MFYVLERIIVMSKFTKCLLLFVAVVVFNSCKTQPTAPAGTATIIGRVLLAQSYFQYTPAYGGINVTIEGTNFSGLTDDSGYYTINSVPTGTYNVLFSKSGYGDVRLFSMSVTGGGNAPVYFHPTQYNTYTMLYKIPNIVTSLREVEIKDTTLPTEEQITYLIAKGNISPGPLMNQLYGGIAVYVSHSSDVSNLLGHYATFFYDGELGLGYANYPIDTTTESFIFGIPQYNLTSAGFNSGDSIYVATYGAPLYNYPPGDYYDPAIQQNVLTSINQMHSAVIGARMP